MTAFAFSTVATILSEAGATTRLGEVIAERFPAARRILIVTDAGFLRTGLLEQPRRSMEQGGMTVAVFSGVVADPPEAIVLDAVEAARRIDADLVLGFSGGSSMDVAKLVAVLAPLTQPLADIYGIGKVLVLPHVLRFNLPEASHLYAELADIVAPGAQGSSMTRAEGLIVAMQQLGEQTGIETTLRQVGIQETDLDRLTDDAMLQTRLLGNNPREVTRADARAIYAAAL